MDYNIFIRSIIGTSLSILAFLIVSVLLCINALADCIGKHLQDSQMHIFALTLGNSTIGKVFINSIIADTYLALTARL